MATSAPAAPALSELFDRARALQNQGQHDAAHDLYRAILASHPTSPEANFRYANALRDRAELAAALASYDRAIALKPDYAHAFCNRAVVLGQLQRLPEALASYDRAVAIDPTDALAWCNRGMLLNALGEKDSALASFARAIAADAQFSPAHFGRGALLQERRDWIGALQSYDRAILHSPGDALSHYNRGTVLKELERRDEALISFDRSIALRADFARALVGRADMLHALNRQTEALGAYDRAIQIDARDATAINNRGVLVQKMGNLSAALANYSQALAVNPDYAEAYFNRGTVLKELGDLDGALSSYQRALAAKPDYADAHVNLGGVLHDKGLLQEAIASYRRAISIDPGLAESYYNLALAALKAGDFPTGWANYEWRWSAKSGPIFRENRAFTQPLWLGREDLGGKSILLYGEQGFGDSLQFCRYAAMVASSGARVILEVPLPLVRICTTLQGVAQVIPYGAPFSAVDFRCPLMSLPLALGTTLETVPATVPYLHSDPGDVAAWQKRLGAQVKPRIGLTWSGNQTAGTNRKRHFLLANLVPYLPGQYQYVCLQTDLVEADRKTLAENPAIINFGNELRDFADTAALCECMDLVVSVDTSVAHLAGALGKRVWVLLTYNADWRWLTRRDDSPWYPTMRLYRQSTGGDWDLVFRRLAADLQEEFHSLGQ